MIAIVDYGMGNLSSVQKAFRFLKIPAKITSDPKQVARARAIVLPGVGAFGEAMSELRKRKLVEPVRGAVRSGKPFLGICLGLQLLFESSEESSGVKGLAVLPGRVKRFSAKRSLKIPQMGWNQIENARGQDRLLKGIPEGAFFYFVHGYVAVPAKRGQVSAWTTYGEKFPSIVSNGANVWATQFHPEKSQRWGLKLLRNFGEIAR